jgi:hypothetical protein
MADIVEARQTGTVGGYRSTGPLTIAILTIVGVHVLASVGQMIAVPLVRARLQDGADLSDLAVSAFFLTWSGSIQLAAFLAAGVCFLVWLHRAYTNLPALGSEALTTMTAKNAVVGWFIPFYNLVHGYRSVHQLYLESQRPAIMPSGFVLPTRAAIVGWWWGLYLSRGVASRIAESAINSMGGDMVMWFNVAAMLDAAAAVLFGLVVWRVYKRQHDQHDDLVRRAQVPQPSAEALR